MPLSAPLAAPTGPAPCIVLIGMPGAGKTTVGGELARALGWAFLDSDHLIEAVYGARLQDITDALDKETFLDAECEVIRAIKANRVVLATGGSVVYREAAMRRLAELGPIVHLDIPLAVVEERVARNPQRGLAIAPGQSLADIFKEREALYRTWATLRCETQAKNPLQCARWIMEHLPQDIPAQHA